MRKLDRLKFVVILGTCIASQTPAFCQLRQNFQVQEMQEGASTEYNVINSSDQFTISAFAIETTGGSPSTTNPHWIAETLNASSWLQPMGGDSALPNWLNYTGLTYAQAFPADPAELNAYVVNDPGAAGGGVISPDNSLDGFFFQGTANSTDRFMLVNDHGPAIIEGQIITAFGTVEVVPEPGTVGLLGLGSAALVLNVCRRKRPRSSLEPTHLCVLSKATKPNHKPAKIKLSNMINTGKYVIRYRYAMAKTSGLNLQK